MENSLTSQRTLGSLRSARGAKVRAQTRDIRNRPWWDKLQIYTSKTNSSRVRRTTKKKRAKRGTAKVRSEATEMLSASQSIGNPLTLNLRQLLNTNGNSENNMFRLWHWSCYYDKENESRPQKITLYHSLSCTVIMNTCTLLMNQSMRVFIALSLWQPGSSSRYTHEYWP